MRISNYPLVFAFLLPFYLIAQDGPAGVGNSLNNGLWLRADKIQQADSSFVSEWQDVSGNMNDAEQTTASLQPVYLESSNLNGQPVVRLDGTNDQLYISDAAILDGSSGLTYYAVVRPRNLTSAPRGILGKRITYNTNIDYAYTWFFYTNSRLYTDINTANNRFSSGSTTYSNNNNYILSLDFDGSQPLTERSRMYSNGNISAIASETSTSIIDSDQDLVLGALNANYGTYLGADYAEVIQFNYSLDSLEHILVSNYLSAKYNIPLGMNDVYVQDNSTNGDYDFDVTGIGRIDASTIVDNAKACSILRISNPTDLNDDEYLIWGHNNKTQVANNNSDVPFGIDARFEREWRVSEVNGSQTSIDVGAVDLTWDLSNLGGIIASDLRLLIDTDNDGIFSDETPISGATSIGGNQYAFLGITEIADSVRFTLATIDQDQTALPVEYISFSGQKMENHNEINWVTASEINNDFFEVEKSIDQENWALLATVNSQGNYRQDNSYTTIDRNLNHEINYYRLKQTDLNGQFSYSKIILIDNNNQRTVVEIYPNPSSEMISIKGKLNWFRIYNEMGEDITRKIGIKASSDHIHHLDVAFLPNGIYFIHSEKGTYSFIKI
ncbi:T9SS type A sorting domain-containing protein [Portibacter lacus]|uniref:Secretion system C-terminal sorting domain-containing protein n=1 Tax=Portibacter lacus TaxID=1099794 RepID=A0AA37SU51_9BACT|nr:T9SS type A sorting domain-containing protein [Portibacter lacus]GLR19759.1 hypothetical protein GCM10007940_43750 [Portibacter lacus]